MNGNSMLFFGIIRPVLDFDSADYYWFASAVLDVSRDGFVKVRFVIWQRFKLRPHNKPFRFFDPWSFHLFATQ